MDSSFLDMLIWAVMGVFGWIGRTLWNAVDKLKEDLNKLEVDMPTSYVRKVDMEARFDRIEAMLERLMTKLDSKVDK